MFYSCEISVFQGFDTYLLRKCVYPNASKLGRYDDQADIMTSYLPAISRVTRVTTS